MLFIRTGRARLGSRIRTAEDHRLGGGCSTRSPVDHTGRAYFAILKNVAHTLRDAEMSRENLLKLR